MKNIFLALCLFLASCAIENSTHSNSMKNEIAYKEKKQNENCMNMKRFKIFQTFPANYALAHDCREDDRDFCFGAIVLLTPQLNVDYYDDMFVTPPVDKCAVQDGIYRYESKSGLNTVPRIRWDFKYKPENKEEAASQLKYFIENSINECKLIFASDEKTNTEENIKNCDCVIKEVFKYNLNELDGNEISSKGLKNHIKEKCGKVLEFL